MSPSFYSGTRNAAALAPHLEGYGGVLQGTVVVLCARILEHVDALIAGAGVAIVAAVAVVLLAAASAPHWQALVRIADSSAGGWPRRGHAKKASDCNHHHQKKHLHCHPRLFLRSQKMCPAFGGAQNT